MPFSLPFFKSNEKEEPYFGLFIKDTEAIGFILEKRSGKIEIIAQKQIDIPDGWDNLVEHVDELLFSLENITHKHVSEIIFFVYSHYVDQTTHDIKKEYLKTFKTLLKQLELKALGYIECYDAVVEYLGKKDEVPLTAVLIELDKKNIGLFVYKGGQRVFAQTTTRSESITSDIEYMFHQMNGAILLPSRIILYDSHDLRSESTAVVSYHWDPELFVQMPRVEVLKQEELNAALCVIFQKQLAAESKTEFEAEVEKEVMGFTIGAEAQDELIPETREESAPKEKEGALFFFSRATGFISMIKQKLPHLTIPQFSGNRLPIIGALLSILVLLFGIEYFFHKARIDVLLPSKNITNEFPYSETIVPNGKIKQAQISLSVSDKINTTGKRDVGEKAHGEVALSSFDDKERVVSRGTILQTGSQKFTLDDDVTVPAQSNTTIDGKQAKIAGTLKGKVTASALGTDGNIAKGQNFTVGDFASSVLSANNTVAFSGGSSKQVQTVARQDIDNLKKTIMEKAKQQATEQIKSGSQDVQILDDLTEINFETVTPSKEIAEEAKELTVNAKVAVDYYSVSPAEIKIFIKDTLRAQVPAGYKIGDDHISYELHDATKKKDRILFTILAKALALKDVSQSEIVKRVAGKPVGALEKILKNDFQASAYDLKFTPSIPIFSAWTPVFKKNISLRISSL